MEIIYDIDKIETPFKKSVITIGNFDGVHLGHQALFKKVIEKANILKATPIAMTFNPHPGRLFNKNKFLPLITRDEQKKELIKETGIEVLIIVEFNKKFSEISALEFAYDILVKKLGVKAVVVGCDYTFGKDRKGNIELLSGLSKKFDFELIVVDDLLLPDNQTEIFNKKISSTAIRELVSNGDVFNAKDLIGRYYQIRGKVISGRNRGGKLIGFPTANIELHDELCPPNGVYAVTVDIDNKIYHGVCNIGLCPTFDEGLLTIEVHIIDFNENLYDKNIKVNFIKRLRDEKKFLNVSELSNQINNDIDTAKTYFTMNKI